jgi:excinuclease ABC subunit C
MDENLSSQLKHLPTSAGVYVYRDADGQPLYVGKAKNLRRRVRQYFTGRQNGRTALLVSHIVSVEIIVAESEREALLMESNLIKTYRPRYNVELKDDKSYPYFRITVQEEYPRLEITRHPDRGESLYFGPFTDVGSARETMNYLHRAFPLRRCKGPEPGGRSRSGRPCLDFQMGRCTGPCEEEIDSEDYRKIVDGLIDFLKGKGMKVARSLEREMNQLSSQQKYEEAALLRDRIQAIYSVLEGQHAVGDPGDDLDVLGYGASNGITVMVCLFIRSGLIVGRREMVMSGQFGAEESFEAFISSHYRKHVHIPPRILFPIGLEFAIEHEEVLSRIAGRKVRIQKPFRGKGAGLIQLANENARQALKSNEAIRSEAADITSEIAHSLDLPVPPRRIECVDISHTSGQLAYGSLVAWENGDLVKRDYRLFSIKGSLTPGDQGQRRNNSRYPISSLLTVGRDSCPESRGYWRIFRCGICLWPQYQRQRPPGKGKAAQPWMKFTSRADPIPNVLPSTRKPFIFSRCSGMRHIVSLFPDTGKKGPRSICSAHWMELMEWVRKGVQHS